MRVPFFRLLAFAIAALLPLSASAVERFGELDNAHFQGLPRTTYPLENFSERYRATLEISDQDEVFRPGILRVYAKQGDVPLIEVSSEELVLDQQTGSEEVRANIHELPYGEQSVLVYQDFNLDGIKDLALMDGQFSCYHGPSYQVFLGTAEGFRHSASFTELAQNYCGLFAVDEKTREISAFTKDGCCWHEFSSYTLENGEPMLKTRTTVAHNDPSGLIVETLAENRAGTLVNSTRRYWNVENPPEVLLSFRLAPAGKRIVLFKSPNDEKPAYVALDKSDEAVLLYPEKDGERIDYDAATRQLRFIRGDTTYRILGDAQGKPVKMQVEARGKVTDLKLQPGGVEGSLDAVGVLLQ
ncbi:XAC2610-related protein [Pseudomonas wadenswilerensis]